MTSSLASLDFVARLGTLSLHFPHLSHFTVDLWQVYLRQALCCFNLCVKGYYFPVEGICQWKVYKRGIFSAKNGIFRVTGRTLGRSLPLLNFFSTPPPPTRAHYLPFALLQATRSNSSPHEWDFSAFQINPQHLIGWYQSLHVDWKRHCKSKVFFCLRTWPGLIIQSPAH